jgi:uncharacterized protein (TIGR02117 family)
MSVKKILRGAIRLLLKAAFGLIIFLAVYFAVEFVASSITCLGEKKSPKEMFIFLQTNGVHTDLIVPIKNRAFDWSSVIDINTTRSKDTSVKYIAIGWGDKGFYLETPSWDELKVSTAAKAALGLSSTAMHCTFHKAPIENENRRRIFLSYKQYKRLVHFILTSFEWTNSRQSILVNTKIRYDEYDTFYEAAGHYSLFKTCNTWTNQALKSAGLTSAYWAAFEGRIMKKYKTTATPSE